MPNARAAHEIQYRYNRLSVKAQYWVKLLDSNRGNSVAREHWQLCHSDGSVCQDGCDAAAIPSEVKASESAADYIAFREHPEDFGY